MVDGLVVEHQVSDEVDLHNALILLKDHLPIRGEYSSLLDHIGDLKKILGREISKGFGREISRGSRKGPKGPRFEIFLQF